VRLLLDSHTLVWWLTDSPLLSRRARRVIADRSNTVFASAVSAYELVNKHRQGKLRPPLADELLPMTRRASLPLLAISFEHAVAAAELPGPHQDPWDRLLMGQARVERLTVVSADPVFADYGVPTLW
jgi:PIN domain nuclease of toxin-antitoxin system